MCPRRSRRRERSFHHCLASVAAGEHLQAGNSQVHAHVIATQRRMAAPFCSHAAPAQSLRSWLCLNLHRVAGLPELWQDISRGSQATPCRQPLTLGGVPCRPAAAGPAADAPSYGQLLRGGGRVASGHDPGPGSPGLCNATSCPACGCFSPHFTSAEGGGKRRQLRNTTWAHLLGKPCGREREELPTRCLKGKEVNDRTLLGGVSKGGCSRRRRQRQGKESRHQLEVDLITRR